MKSKRTKAVVGMLVGGALTVLSPLIGFMATFSGMHGAFSTLGKEGTGNPQELSGHIGTVLYANIASIAGVMIGLVTLVISLLVFLVTNKRPDAGTPPPQ